MKINKKNVIDNLATIFYALIIAIIFRTFFFQPFYIISSIISGGFKNNDIASLGIVKKKSFI